MGAPPDTAEAASDTLTYALPEVRIEVSRLAIGGVPLTRAPFGSQVVSDRELQNEMPLTIADAVTRLPGISAADELGSPAQPDLTLRGFAASPVVGLPQGVSVFVDGIRVNEPDASQVNFDLIPSQAIERIEVLRGPSGPFGKNTLAGAVNIVTWRPSSELSGRAELTGGRFDQGEGQGSVSGRHGNISYLLSGRYLRSNGWRDEASIRLGNLFTRAGWQGRRTTAGLSYTFAQSRIFQAGSLPQSWLNDPTSIPAAFDPGSDVDPRTINFTGGDFFGPRLHFLAGHLNRHLSGHVTLEANAFYRHNDIEQFNANFIEPNTRSLTGIRSTGGAAQLLYERAPLQLTGGAEYSFNHVDIEIFERPNSNFPDIPEDGRLGEDVGTREHNVGLFTQARFAATERLALSGALRFDHVSLPFEDHLEPENSGDNRFRQLTGTAGVDYQIAPGTVVFASYGRGFRAPVILELACASPEDPCPLPYELGADPPLDPVTTDTWQAGLRFFRTDRFSAELVGYWSEVYDDIFTVQPVDARAGYFDNLERTRRQGAELTLTLRPVDSLRLAGTVAYTRATYQTTARLAGGIEREEEEADEDLDLEREPPVVQPGDRFPMVPDWQTSAQVAYTRHPWRAGIDLQHVGRQWLRGDEDNSRAGLRLDSYVLVNARLERTLGRFTLFVVGKNILNTAYESFGVLALNMLGGEENARIEPFVTPGHPRQMHIGMRYQF